ncbi:MAG: cupin domain-containing protein [Zoogloeaceae bacterium]|uniref:cupin domain-containing protein n=1 Tax=Denitromonas sp. TaxID=2734609 RepID=UPI002FDD48B3|nr:cupin domain-containing protein [Zoogloeaceae bacterium]
MRQEARIVVSNISSDSTPSSDTPFVGARIRELRHQKGVSQRELARRSGVTNGMISLIEQNKTSPSVALLKKVLSGFPMSLADFFTGVDEAESTPVFFAAHQLKVMDNGAIRFRQLGDQLQGRSMQIMSETYPPGADTGETMLAHDSEEGGFVVRGRIEVTVGHQSTLLGPGDGYYFDSRLPHRFRNVGDETCELISACSPPSF